MRVLMIPSWYMSEKNQTKGSFFREQALMLKQNNHDIAVMFVQIHSLSEKIDETFEQRNDEGILTFIYHIHSYGYAHNVNLFKAVLLHYYKRMINVLIKDGFQPDLIQAHAFMPAGMIAVSLGKRYGIPVITTEHSSKVHTLALTKPEIRMLRATVDGSNAFACVSDSLKQAVLKYCPNKNIDILSNNLWSGFQYRDTKSKGIFTFVSVGNLIKPKRHDFAIKCFEKAFTQNEDVQLIIAGGGVEESELNTYVEQRKLGNRVKLIGRIGREQMVELLNSAHVLTLLSTNETFGVVYIEGMACGCPVIATRNGGADEFIDASNGILVDIDDMDATVEAMQSVYKNYHNYDLKKISDDCISKYGESAVSKCTEEIYSRIVRR